MNVLYSCSLSTLVLGVDYLVSCNKHGFPKVTSPRPLLSLSRAFSTVFETASHQLLQHRNLIKKLYIVYCGHPGQEN